MGWLLDKMKTLNLIIYPLIVSIVIFSGCGKGSSGDTENSVKYDIPLQLLVNDVDVKANEQNQFSFNYDFPFFTPAFTNFSVDLNQTLKDINISPSGANNKASSRMISDRSTDQVQMYAYISSTTESSSTCQDGERYGPFTVEVENGNKANSITPAKATATKPTLSVVNSGAFTLCLEIVSPIAAKLDVDGVSIEATTCGQEPANIAGQWSGTFACTNEGTSNDSGDILITIIQDGYSAKYSDGEASYKGTVCGNIFEYEGGVPYAYDESGTLTFNADGSAKKTSSWDSIYDDSSGNCEDSLQRKM